MPAWVGAWLDNQGIAIDGALLIAEKQTSVVFYRKSVPLSAQTVRLDMASASGSPVVGPTGMPERTPMVILGYRGHPTIANTDCKIGDRFEVDHIDYVVDQIMIETPYTFLATATAQR